MTQPRSSLAIALQDYKGPRPGVALTIAAAALIAALVVGVIHLITLNQASSTIAEARQTMRTLHSYNAALEVWRQIGEVRDSAMQFPAQTQHRDSLAGALRGHLDHLRNDFQDPGEQALVDRVLTELSSPDAATMGVGENGRAAMVVLMASRDSALFQLASDYQESQFFASLIIALAIISAGVLIIPMSWVYVRYKRGIPPGM
jgi:hypothetical protein